MSEQLLWLSFQQYKKLRNQIRNFQYKSHNKIKKLSVLCPFIGFLLKKYVYSHISHPMIPYGTSLSPRVCYFGREKMCFANSLPPDEL